MFEKAWEYFIRCVELGSFAQAAHSLNIQQSTISQAIAKLEAIYEVKLFDRTPGRRRLTLTPAGQIFSESLTPLKIDFDNRILPLAIGAIPVLRIGCVQHIGIKYLLPLLNNPIYQSIKRHIYLVPRRSHLMTGIEKNHFDLAIISGPLEKGSGLRPLADDPYMYVGLKKKFDFIRDVKTAKEMDKIVKLYQRRPFQAQWSDLIPTSENGYFVDDHFAIQNLILGGYIVSPYQLDYFTTEELKSLAFSPAKAFLSNWKIQAFVLHEESSPLRETIENLIVGLTKLIAKERILLEKLIKGVSTSR